MGHVWKPDDLITAELMNDLERRADQIPSIIRTINLALTDNATDVAVSSLHPSDDAKAGDYIIDSTGSMYLIQSVSDNAATIGSKLANFQGPQGIQGVQGLKGDKGDKGDTGSAGSNGKSAYELWKAISGNESKTEAEFIASLKGAKGDKGDTGADGPKGDKGDTGAAGSNGAAATVEIGTVTTGAAGTQASVTNAGTTSAAKFNFVLPQGAKGDKGDKGDTGPEGPQGPAGTAASVPKSMEIAIDTVAGTISGALMYEDGMEIPVEGTVITGTTA